MRSSGFLIGKEMKMNEARNRYERACKEYHRMKVTPDAPFKFEVETDGHPNRRYQVDLAGPSCTCPDFRQRKIKCKHIWRVEMEGYERPVNGPDSSSIFCAPSDPDKWRPDNDFVWFDSRVEMFSEFMLKHIRCYWASGQKKEIKFWVAIPHFPAPGALTLCWGDFNEMELRRSHKTLGQSREVSCRDPFEQARSRGWKKLNKGYAPMSHELAELLLDRLATQFAEKGYDPQQVNPESRSKPLKKTEKSRTDWRPDNNFVWF